MRSGATCLKGLIGPGLQAVAGTFRVEGRILRVEVEGFDHESGAFDSSNIKLIEV